MGDWRNVRLGDLGEVNRGRSRYRPRDAAHLYGGPYPFIQTGDIKNANGRITRHNQTYSDDGLAQSRLWPANTMAITIAANIAETALLTYPACFPDSVVGFIADPSKADVRFIEYLFRLLRKKIQHENVGTGSVQDNINLQTLERLVLRIPDVNQQRSIASVLSALDDKIEVNRRMNDTLEKIACMLFKDWFVDFGPSRAKMRGEKPYLAADLWAKIPDRLDLDGFPSGWRRRPVYEIADFSNGAAYKDMHFSPGREGLPVIKIAELKAGVTDTTRFTSTDLGERFHIQTGDILFSWSGNPDTSIDTFIWDGGPAWLNQHIFRVRENGRATRSWVYFQLRLLRSEFAEIARNKQTTGLGHVTVGDMKRLMVCEPSETAAEAFNEIVDPMFERLLANQLECRDLAKIRDTLLPKLISGEIHVKDAERVAEAAL